MQRRFDDVQEAEIARRYGTGETVAVIGHSLGCSPQTIANILRRLGVALRTRNPVITDEQNELALRLCRDGKTIDEAAAEAGVSNRHVKKLLADTDIEMRQGRPPEHDLNHAAFDQPTPEALYWYGFLLADGALHYDNYGSPILATGLSVKDRGHVEKLRAFLGSTHTIGINTAGEGTFGGDSSTFRVRSKQIAEALVKWGFTTVKAERLPRGGAENSRDFWRGMVDGDGSVGKPGGCYDYISLNGQHALMCEFRTYLNRNNISCGNVNRKGVIWSVKAVRYQAIKAISLLYEGATVFLDRKFANARAALQNRGRL